MESSNLRVGVYRHFKGNYYLLIGIANHSETQEKMVIYTPLYEKPGPAMWARPYEMFVEEVEHDGKKVKRFEYVGEEIPGNLD